MNLKQIDRNIRTITTNAAKLNDLIHVTALAIMAHAAGEGKGDCTRALTLVQAMPASMRRTMLIAWFAKYSPITVKLGDEPKVGINKGKNANAYDLVGADAEPFHKLAEQQPEEVPFDLARMLKLVDGLTKRIEKKLEAGEVPEDQREKASALVIDLSAVRAKRAA